MHCYLCWQFSFIFLFCTLHSLQSPVFLIPGPGNFVSVGSSLFTLSFGHDTPTEVSVTSSTARAGRLFHLPMKPSIQFILFVSLSGVLAVKKCCDSYYTLDLEKFICKHSSDKSQEKALGIDGCTSDPIVLDANYVEFSLFGGKFFSRSVSWISFWWINPWLCFLGKNMISKMTDLHCLIHFQPTRALARAFICNPVFILVLLMHI